MKIISAKLNIKHNVIILTDYMHYNYVFNLNNGKTLPKWAEKECRKLHFLSQHDCWIYFVR